MHYHIALLTGDITSDRISGVFSGDTGFYNDLMEQRDHAMSMHPEYLRTLSDGAVKVKGQGVISIAEAKSICLDLCYKGPTIAHNGLSIHSSWLPVSWQEVYLAVNQSSVVNVNGNVEDPFLVLKELREAASKRLFGEVVVNGVIVEYAMTSEIDVDRCLVEELLPSNAPLSLRVVHNKHGACGLQRVSFVKRITAGTHYLFVDGAAFLLNIQEHEVKGAKLHAMFALRNAHSGNVSVRGTRSADLEEVVNAYIKSRGSLNFKGTKVESKGLFIDDLIEEFLDCASLSRRIRVYGSTSDVMGTMKMIKEHMRRYNSSRIVIGDLRVYYSVLDNEKEEALSMIKGRLSEDSKVPLGVFELIDAFSQSAVMCVHRNGETVRLDKHVPRGIAIRKMIGERLEDKPLESRVVVDGKLNDSKNVVDALNILQEDSKKWSCGFFHVDGARVAHCLQPNELVEAQDLLLRKLTGLERKMTEQEKPASATAPDHYKAFHGDSEQWLDTMKNTRFKDPRRMVAALELQVRKYLDREGGKDSTVQELTKAAKYLVYWILYLKTNGKSTFQDVHKIFDAAGL